MCRGSGCYNCCVLLSLKAPVTPMGVASMLDRPPGSPPPPSRPPPQAQAQPWPPPSSGRLPPACLTAGSQGPRSRRRQGPVTRQSLSQERTGLPPASQALTWARWGGGGLLPAALRAQLCGRSACLPGAQWAAWASGGESRGRRERRAPAGAGCSGPGVHGRSLAALRPEPRSQLAGLGAPGGAVGGAGAGRGSE